MPLSKAPARGPLTPARLVALIVALVVALSVGVSVAIVVDSDPSPPAIVSVPTENAEGLPAPVSVPAGAVDQAKAGELHEGARSEQPDGVSKGDLNEAAAQQEDLAARDDLPSVSPLAAPQQAGCTTRTVQNKSSRRGVAPRLFVIHYTVSPNRPGWSDVWSIVSLFDRPAFSASSSYVIDRTGNCAYIVPEAYKPWTQAAFNPVSISVEVINSGREGSLMDAAGYTKLGRVISDSAKRWGIPLRLGAVSGCTVTRSGIVTHQMLGACGGGHVDVSPYSVAPVVAAAVKARGAVSAQASKRGATCNKLKFHRAKFAKQRRGKAGSKERDAFNARVAKIRELRTLAKAIGLNESKCRR